MRDKSLFLYAFTASLPVVVWACALSGSTAAATAEMGSGTPGTADAAAPPRPADSAVLDEGVTDAPVIACVANGDTAVNKSALFPDIPVGGSGHLYARFVTSMGTMVAKLEETLAPHAVKNFVGLATGHQDYIDPKTRKLTECTPFYTDTTFHRVIPGFMIQSGDRLGTGTGGPGYKFGGEKGTLKHDGPGVLAYANSGGNTDGSQFYITEVATPGLDGGYSVFGKLVVGVELVSGIAAVERDAQDKPLVPVVLKSVEIFRSKTVPTS